jgi:hypothetical protein
MTSIASEIIFIILKKVLKGGGDLKDHGSRPAPVKKKVSQTPS